MKENTFYSKETPKTKLKIYIILIVVISIFYHSIEHWFWKRISISKIQNILFSSASDIAENRTFFDQHYRTQANKVILTLCKFYCCRQDSLMSNGCDGGAIYLSVLSLKVENCTFRGNFASRVGGAVYFRSSSIVDIKNTVFDDNTASDLCGSLFLFNVFDVSIQNSNFSRNSAFSVSTIAFVYCPNVCTGHNFYYNNNAQKNGTLFIENSIVFERSSVFLKNFAGIVSAVFSGGNSESTFNNTFFLDEVNMSFMSANNDRVHNLVDCVFSKDIKSEIRAENIENVKILGFTISTSTQFIFDNIPPIPTRAANVKNAKTQPPEEGDKEGLSADSPISSRNPKWKIVMAFLYFVAICLLIHSLYKYFSGAQKIEAKKGLRLIEEDSMPVRRGIILSEERKFEDVDLNSVI